MEEQAMYEVGETEEKESFKIDNDNMGELRQNKRTRID